MPSVCKITSPSTNMDYFSFFLDTKYGSISFQYKDGGFSLDFKDGFRLQDCFDDNPPKPIENAPSLSEIKDYLASSNFEGTSPPRIKTNLDDLPLKATCDLLKDTGRRRPIMKRCNFPKKTTAMLKEWLLQNSNHPYPSEEEKCRLAGATNLSLRQVNDWMINARRRYLKKKKKYFKAK